MQFPLQSVLWYLRQYRKIGYLAMMTVIFFWASYKTNFFPRVFGVSTLEKIAHDDFRKLASAIYLQVSTISQALIFVTRYRSWSYAERPGILFVVSFVIAQLSMQIEALRQLKGSFLIRYALSGRAWDLVIEQRIAFTRQKDFGKEQQLNHMPEEAKRRAEIARLRELHKLKGHVESVVRLKGLDINTIQQAYTF
ncbi:PLASMA MEMBRANE ATPASE 1 [Salix viminalis]|uniref:PLASMA MEMBRANE ATPASE 1 n=1 Tax=Salix viminalis TaxID=40686 RepID=A0A9Q0SHA0_SALVM|nr:PLASMA MEMBRANE ATPASE 1 [Salix viminalis]